jgi:hypothetical protein
MTLDALHIGEAQKSKSMQDGRYSKHKIVVSTQGRAYVVI